MIFCTFIPLSLCRCPLPLSLFILLWIDACGVFEVTAEIGGGGETKLEGCLLDALLGVGVHDALRLCCHILLNPFQG